MNAVLQDESPRTARYAQVVRISKKSEWQIDRDLLQDRQFDFTRNFLPAGLSRVDTIPFLSTHDARLLSQIQGRTYANIFGLVERFITAKLLEIGKDHWLGDQMALEALVRFSDEELKHQALFRRIEKFLAEIGHLGRLVPRPLYRLLFNLALSSHGGFCTVSRQWDKAGDEPVLRMIRGIQPVFTHWRDLWSRHVPFYHVRALREWQRRVECEGLEPYRLAEA